ncbi:MAG TPA: dihydroorotase family protein [Candidatus Acidoferrum sp.]|jgi:dihydroorotase (multifunctional complex type)|nr:dihydroorotase family protein [Candidatus Acidoferrum sp.]
MLANPKNENRKLIVDLVLNGAKAYVNKEIVDCSLAIDDGRIVKIGKETRMPQADSKIDLHDLLVLPGLIDAHVHLRDEGKAYKEDFFSGTSAAAAGGFTTVLDMPNNDPVTMSVETLRNRMEKAERTVLVNVGFFSEFPKNLNEMEGIVRQGAVAFKLFMVEQVGGLNVNDNEALQKAFKTAARLSVPVAAHAEDPILLKKAIDELKQSNRNDIGAYIIAHSDEVEEKAVTRLLSAAGEAKNHLHVCHLTTGKGLVAVVDGKKSQIQVTCETTPHNLFFSADDLKRIGTLALTMPPVRDKRNVAALWQGIQKGWIDTLGSDHAPHTLNEKEAESIWNVKVGIPGLETTLPLLLTAVHQRRLSIDDIVRLMAEKPAEIFKLTRRGLLKEGNAADLSVIDLKREFKIDASKFHSRAKYSPFDGWSVKGKAVKVFVNGQLIMEEGEIVAKAGSGTIIQGD